ncbi:MAG: DUF1460 domain-containing protein [Candidatus Lokiarchaeota archaeon]|nr:DUF1460 domain-containing protein [Candidatus Lokiarchaeota archaeon]
MSIAAIDEDIRKTSEKIPDYAGRIVYYSERFIDAPYDLTATGEGEHGRYDQNPLLNLKKVNCMTLCETVLAMALSEYYEEMFNVLQHIRYRDGIMGMASRNHYTMADWLPANSWCLDDVSALVGAEDTRQLKRTISHRKFFEQKGIDNIPVMLPDREVTIEYIPLNKLRDHIYAIQSGDIVALIQDRPGIFSAHMLLAIKEDGELIFRHAPLWEAKVVDSPFKEYLEELKKERKYIGMSFMRVKQDIDWKSGHGKFIIE